MQEGSARPRPPCTHCSYCLDEWFNLGMNYALYEVLMDGTNETWACNNVIPANVNATQWVIDNYLDGARVRCTPGTATGLHPAFPVRGCLFARRARG